MNKLDHRHGVIRGKGIALALACAVLSGWVIAEEPEASEDWVEDLGLFVFGGPASTGINIRLNGHDVAKVEEGGGGATHEIGDAMESGVNELVVEFLANDTPAEGRERLTVALATSQLGKDGRRTLAESVAESSLPPDPGASTCTERFRFWAGPPPESADELKKRYWVLVHGPPVGHLVTIVINDWPVYTTIRGERFFEVTPFILKGKNTVEFDAVPGCFKDEIVAEGRFSITIAAGRMDENEFKWEGQALGEFDLVQQKNPQPVTRKQNFRAR